ncbi:uncharacterized protein LOC132388966 [Hypanus sabinus]|uniref:uncharacterized protein LOC132388966 n=1 Tax=Hypanus sabinus TaxID=79690 RepID=UPI0028C4CBAF|nr:uncharacterized protein LOC132388966 [Hypanus sabinus]
MENCSPAQYRHNDRCCSKCQKGFYQVEECSNTKDTKCQACEPGEYMDHLNFMSNCLRCAECETRSNLIKNASCTATHNTVCQCKGGHYCLHEEQGKCQRCKRISQCGSGNGVIRNATHKSDIHCAPCPPGTFSNVTDSWSPCQNHTVCALSGRFTAQPGNEHQDTACEQPIADSGWMWKVTLSGVTVPLLFALFALIAVWVCRRRKGQQGGAGNQDTEQMDELLQLRKLKIMNETSQEVVEGVLDIHGWPKYQQNGVSLHTKLVNGHSEDNVLLSSLSLSATTDIIKGSSRSLPQTLVYENLRPYPHMTVSEILSQMPVGAQNCHNPDLRATDVMDEDGLETDHADLTPESRSLNIPEAQASGAGLSQGLANEGVSRPRSWSQASSLAVSSLDTGGAPRPLSSEIPYSPAPAVLGPPTLTASEVLGRDHLLPLVSIRVCPPSPPPRPPKAGATHREGQDLHLSAPTLQPEEDEWTE